MKDIRNLPYRRNAGLVPEELIGKTATCPKFGTQVSIPWLEKLPFPQQPIKPNDGIGNWVPASIPLRCHVELCTCDFFVEVPRQPNDNRWALYGDEAGRYVALPDSQYSSQPLHFFCISLVALHARRHERVRKQIRNIKRSIFPSKDPDSWSHHFTEIWSGNAASSGCELCNKEEKIAYARRFAKIIRDAHPS
jgi:hypothetical protein